MPLSDLSLSTLFLIFVLVFVLVGLSPAWKQNAGKLRRLLAKLAPAPKDRFSGTKDVLQKSHVLRPGSAAPLDSYENLVFNRLARAGTRGISRRQLAKDLHLQPANIQRTLKSLSRRGLILVAVSHLLKVRFFLSDRGRARAVALDLSPALHKR